MTHPVNPERFAYSVPRGEPVPHGEYKVTQDSKVKIARVEAVRQKPDGTWFVEGTLWPAEHFGGSLPEATFLP